MCSLLPLDVQEGVRSSPEADSWWGFWFGNLALLGKEGESAAR